MFEVEDGRQKMRVKRQEGQWQQPTQGKDDLRLKGQQRLKKEKDLVLTHRKPSVATQGYAGEDPSEINGARGDSGTARVRSEIRDKADLGLFLVVWTVRLVCGSLLTVGCYGVQQREDD
jgi:hypothetical protein